MKIFKYFILLLLFLSSKEFLNAQQNDPPNWAWAKNLDGNTTNITSDSIGNTYVLGSFSTDVTFGSATLTGSGAYVVKSDSAGLILWARKVANGTLTPNDIAIDQNNNYYLVGTFSNTVTVGGVSLTSGGLTDMFYGKFDANGVTIFAGKYGGIYDDEGKSIVADKLGNSYIAGSKGGNNGSSTPYYDEISSIKLNATGTIQWFPGQSGNWETLNYGGVRNFVNSISLDAFGNSYITGNYKPYSGSDQFFVLKRDPSGNLVWLRGGTGNAVGNEIITDANGNSYVSGQFSSSAGFGSFNLSSAGLWDAFVVKYDAAGQVAWAKAAGGVDNDYAEGVTIDIQGNAYVSGRFQQNAVFSTIAISNVNSGVSDVYVAKYNSIGEVIWVSNVGDGGVDSGKKITIDQAKNLYLNGVFASSIAFGTSILNGTTSNSFIAKLGSNIQDSLAIFTNELSGHSYIAGSSIDVSFDVFGNYASGNYYSVQLSDASGGFFYPTPIGTGLSSPIAAIIPPLTIPGALYRIRVIANAPNIIGTDNGSNFVINNSSQQITPDWSWSENNSGISTNIATDSIGNNYVIGDYSSAVTFGSTTLAGSGVYVVKYDSIGTILWARQVASGVLSSKDIAIDKFGNYYIVGTFSNTVTVGGISLTSAGLSDMFYSKFDASGVNQYANKLGGVYDDEGNSITVDRFGNCFFAGGRGGFNGSSYYDDVLTLKLNSSGTIQWTKSLAGNWETLNYGGVRNFVNGVSVDNFGNSYVTGNYRPFSGSDQFFLLKYDPSGNQVWLRGGTGYAIGNEIVTDVNGNSYISGQYYTNVGFGSFNLTSAGMWDAFVVKYDAAGQVSWAKSAGGFDNDYATGLDLDKNSNVYVSGKFQHSAYFSGINISNFNSGVSDVFVAKFDNLGNALWLKQAGFNGIDDGLKIGVSNYGTSFITGRYSFEIEFDNHALVGNQVNSYLAAIGSNYETSIGNAILIAGTNICAGNVFKIEYPVKGIFNTGNVFTAQLSDENGSFASPIDIGNITSEINNTIYAIIPDVTPGTGYRIRVVSSNIPLIGIDNGINLSINLANCDNVAPVLEIFPLVAFEYFFDTDNGVGTYVEIPVTANDSISLIHSISVAGLSTGFHNLFIRFKDSLNIWSLYEGRVIYVQPIITQTDEAPIVSAEYFFDADPGVGNGLAIASFVKADSINLVKQISVAGLSVGFHNLFIRVKDSLNIWSLYEGRVIYVQPIITQVDPAPIVSAEYFFNSPDPGVGNGFPLASFTKADSIDILRNINTSGLPNGFNNLFIRVKDSLNVWSLYEGRKFFICPDVLATPSITANNSICQDATISGTGSTVANATSYLWTGPSGFTQAGQTLSRANATPSMNGIYTFYAIRTGGTKCDTSFASVTINVNPVFTVNNPQIVCENDSYSINGNVYLLAGNYIDTLTSINGCDSIVNTQLTVIPTIHADNFQNLCGTATYSFNGNIYSTNGTYIDTIQTINGCDSIVTTYLTINPIYVVNNPQTICSSGSYTINGNTYTVAGTYVDNMQTGIGCDSIVTTQLTVVTSFASTNPQTICQGGSYSINGNTYIVAGSYPDLFQSINGCDSTVTTILTVNPTFTTSNPQTICQGGSYSINGNTYTLAGTYSDLLQSVNGCDSTVNTILTVNPTFATTNPQAICPGGSYSINGNIYTVANTYIDLMQTVNGCDSVVTTILTVNPIYAVNNPQLICTNGSYTINGNTYTLAGNYVDNLQTLAGCDSIVTTQLTVVSSFASNNPQTICSGSSYSINGNVYTIAGSYNDTLISVNACDSIVTTILTVNPTTGSTNPQTICQGGSYSINGNTYTVAGSFPTTFQAINGCDSIVTTILTVNPTFATTNPQTICQGESYTINGVTYTVAGSYPTSFQTINGCDSIVTTILTVNPTILNSNPQTICAGSSYLINGNTYALAGSYNDTLISATGCDSVVTTILTVTNPTLNTNVSFSGTTLSSLENNATYQWLDCGNNNLQIASATNQSFTAIENGSYAVQLTSLTCNLIATSLCFTIDNVGVDEVNKNFNLSIYPNPTAEFFTIESKEFSLGNIKIFDASCKLIFEKIESQNSLQIDSKNWSDGVYMIEISSEKGIFHQKIIKE